MMKCDYGDLRQKKRIEDFCFYKDQPNVWAFLQGDTFISADMFISFSNSNTFWSKCYKNAKKISSFSFPAKLKVVV